MNDSINRAIITAAIIHVNGGLMRDIVPYDIILENSKFRAHKLTTDQLYDNKFC
jgi:hypothetical protein